MVISDKHRYVFVEVPHTGSHSIAAELMEHYDGRKIIYKHAKYHEFLRVATTDQRGYFVFGGIRHPMDDVVSTYFKLLTNHNNRYPDPPVAAGRKPWYLDKVRFIREANADFPTYFMRFYRNPYDTWTNLAHHRFGYVMRFESLTEDFARVLQALGLEQVRPLPRANPTAGRSRDFGDYYPPHTRARAASVFGPYMRRWGYSFPPEWGDVRVPVASWARYYALRPLRRYLYLRQPAPVRTRPQTSR